jgi:PmbA protein
MRGSHPRPRRRTGPDPRRGRRAEEGSEILERALSLLPGEGDVRVTQASWTTLRVANSVLYQPHFEQSWTLSIRVATEEGRLGVATTSRTDREGLEEAVREAHAAAREAPALSDFPGFPRASSGPKPRLPLDPTCGKPELDRLSRDLKASLGIIEEKLGTSRISGAVNLGLTHLWVGNTQDLRQDSSRSVAQASWLTERLAEGEPAGSGWAERAGWSSRRLDLPSLAREAANIAPRSPAVPIPPGRYRVLLGGSALFELLSYLSWMGVGAHPILEGWSALARQQGRRVAARIVTLREDPWDPQGLPEAIDAEGLLRKPRPILRFGVFRGPSHDTFTASRASTRSTHEAIPPEAPYGNLGPIPRHLSLEPGDADHPELLQELGRGLLITRFHYVRAVHPGRLVLTGMTRDGTYWVEGGEVRHPVQNLRFTESVLKALEGAELLGAGLRGYSDERGFLSAVLPSLVCRSFRFSSRTTF